MTGGLTEVSGPGREFPLSCCTGPGSFMHRTGSPSLANTRLSSFVVFPPHDCLLPDCAEPLDLAGSGRRRLLRCLGH